MLSLIYVLFTIALGATCGYIGVISEATVLTDRSIYAAMKTGALLSCAFAVGLSSIWPEYTIAFTALSAILAVCRWHILIPIINWCAKAAYTFIQNRTK